MHSFSSASDQRQQDEFEDPTAQNVPKSITHLEQCIARVQSQLEHLNSAAFAVPRTELTSDFALTRSAELEAERNRIRNADVSHARQLAESYLMRLREAERRNAQQHQRMEALETRTTMAESIGAEQMTLNRELADESIRTLRQFADAERRRAALVKAANQRCDSLTRELDRCKAQRDQHEQAIGRLREREQSLNQEISSLAHQLNKAESEKNGLRMERDKFKAEADSVQCLLVEQENTIGGMRERESKAAWELRKRDEMIDELVKQRDDTKLEVVRTRKEFDGLLARQEQDADKRIEEKRKQVAIELRAQHAAEIEQYRQALKRHKSDFTAAMQEALRETQKLAAEREEYFNNWRRLEETLEQYKQKLKATLSRKMVAKCSELVRDLKDIGADENGRLPSTPRTLEPVENVAQHVLDQMASQRESDFS